MVKTENKKRYYIPDPEYAEIYAQTNVTGLSIYIYLKIKAACNGKNSELTELKNSEHADSSFIEIEASRSELMKISFITDKRKYSSVLSMLTKTGYVSCITYKRSKGTINHTNFILNTNINKIKASDSVEKTYARELCRALTWIYNYKGFQKIPMDDKFEDYYIERQKSFSEQQEFYEDKVASKEQSNVVDEKKCYAEDSKGYIAFNRSILYELLKLEKDGCCTSVQIAQMLKIYLGILSHKNTQTTQCNPSMQTLLKELNMNNRHTLGSYIYKLVKYGFLLIYRTEDKDKYHSYQYRFPKDLNYKEDDYTAAYELYTQKYLNTKKEYNKKNE